MDYDSRQKFEHELINNKITWLLSSQALLFAAFSLALGNAEVSKHQLVFLKVISALGIFICTLIFLGVCMGIWAKFKNYKDECAENWGVRTSITRIALIPDLFMPIGFIIAWIILRSNIASQ